MWVSNTMEEMRLDIYVFHLFRSTDYNNNNYNNDDYNNNNDSARMVCVDVSGKKFAGKYFQEILRRGTVGDGSGGESWTDLAPKSLREHF